MDNIPKEQLREWITSVQEDYKRRNKKKLAQITISKELGYNANHISRILAEDGVISEDFVLKFNSKYGDILKINHHGSPHHPPMDIQKISAQPMQLDNNLKVLPNRLPYPFDDAEYLYRFTGDSMYPKIPSGAELAVKKIADTSVIISGEIYLIYLKNGLSTVRYINLIDDNQDELILAPYNERAKNTKVSRKDIAHLFKIQFILTRV